MTARKLAFARARVPGAFCIRPMFGKGERAKPPERRPACERQLSRHIVGADSREGGEGKRHEVCRGGSLIARHTHAHTRA
jgi:hypothetical protein